MKLLHIDSSVTGLASASRRLSGALVGEFARANPGLAIVYRDLDAEPIAHLHSATLAQDLSGGDALEQFLAADIVVIGAPMYNFGVSSQLKAWLDRILIAGKTFRYSEAGPVGLAGGKKVIIASSRGNFYGPGAPAAANDFQENYLRAVFAFIGVTDVEFVRAEGLAFGPDQREAAIVAALDTVPQVAANSALPLAA